MKLVVATGLSFLVGGAVGLYIGGWFGVEGAIAGAVIGLSIGGFVSGSYLQELRQLHDRVDQLEEELNKN